MKHVHYLMRSSILLFLLTFTLIGSALAQDLSVTMMADKPAPLSGDEVTFTVVATHVGGAPFTVTNVSIPLPAGLAYVTASSSSGTYTPPGDVIWNAGALAVSATKTLTFKAKVLIVTPMTVCATLSASTPTDVSTSNNKSCAALTPMEQSQFWMPANLDAGTVTAIDDSPNHPVGGLGPTLFVGTDGGGVYRSVDNGNNWYPTALINKYTRGIKVSDRNNAVWAVTYDDGAHRSGDLGDSYSKASLPVVTEFLLSVAVNSHNPKNSGGDGDVWLGSDGDGVFYSKDAGPSTGTFTQENSGLPTGGGRIIRSLAVLPAGRIDVALITNDRDRIFAGTHGRGLWYIDHKTSGSNNIDNDWQDASGTTLSLAVVHAIAFSGTGTGAKVYVGTNDGVYEATNGTWSWTKILDKTTASLSLPTWQNDLVIRSLRFYNDGTKDYLAAGSDGDHLFVYDVVAGSWKQEDGLTNPPNGTVSGLQSRTVLSLHYLNQVLYAGTQDKGVHKSTNNGLTFEQISNVSLNTGHQVIHDLVFHNGKLFGASYGFGVIMSDDFNTSAPILNWTRVNNGLVNPFVYSLLSKSQYLFAGTWGSGVYRSADNGESWQPSGLANRIVYDMKEKGTQVFAATDRGEVARSADNGLTWQETGVATTAIISLGFQTSPSVMYAGTFGQGLYKSADGGFTWTQSNLKTGYIFDLAVNGSTIYAGTALGVLKSTDGFATWTTVANNVGLTSKEVHSIGLASGKLLAGTWGGGVFQYDTTNDVWVRNGFPGGHITVFAVNPTTGGLVIASQGQGVFQMPTASVTANEGSTDVPNGFALSQNFPNPFNPTTQIAFALPEAATVRLTVYNALGQQVRVLVDGMLSAGMHSVDFDAANLPSGTYLYRLETPSRTLNRTMVLMK